MTDLGRLETDTALDEGDKSAPYLDTLKRWSFGRGRCLETAPLTGPEWKALLDRGYITVSLSPAGSALLEARQLAAIAATLEHDYDFWPKLNDARQNALVELAYQIGVAGELAFHDMIAAIRVAVVDNNWVPVATAALQSDWARETPVRAKIVVTQLCTGQFASGR